jgi:nucleoside-diphosphate-sugar epimerase
MLKALITGVEGFTGHHLAAELQSAGYEVSGLVHQSPEMPISGVIRTHVCDLNVREGLTQILEETQPDVVVHLAAISFVAHVDVEAIYRTNVLGTRNLLEALANGGWNGGCQPRALLLASSANIYGNATVEPIDESVPPAPANDYAVSKLAMEYVARLWFDRLPITLVRPFNYTGAGQSLNFLLPKIVDHFRRRAPLLELGNLDVVRDFSDVRSVVQSYRLLLEAGLAGETFNICSGQGHSLLEVVQMVRELTGHDPEVRVNPAFVRASEVHRLVGSRARLDAAIGVVPSIPLRDTLQWMLESPD